MDIGVSPITNTIYAGKSKDCGNGIKAWIGKKEDVTDEAIKAVFEWFVSNHKANEPHEGFEVKYPNCPYVLTMAKQAKNDV